MKIASIWKKLGFMVVGGLGAWSALALNNDGKTDLYFRYAAADTNVVWILNGTTYSSTTPLVNTGDTNWKMAGTGDFNNDGQLDILFRHGVTGQNGVWFMNGSTKVSSGLLNTVSDLNWQIVGTGYFVDAASGTFDQNIDILWRNVSSGENAIWRMSGTNFIAGVTVASAAAGWKIGGTGDVNGDGYTDILWRDTGTGGQTAVWFMQNATVSSTSLLSHSVPDQNWSMTGAGYFNPGAGLDIVWRDGSDGEIAVWLMSGTNSTSGVTIGTLANYTVGGAGDGAVDSDGDSMSDLWERRNFGVLSHGGNDDYDHDGLTNLQEFQNGTVPTKAEVHVLLSHPSPGSVFP